MNLDTRSYSQQLRVLSYPHNVLGSKAIALLLFPPSNMISPALGGLTLPRRQTSFLGILLASQSLPLLVPSSWTGCLAVPPSTCLPQALCTCFFFFPFWIPFLRQPRSVSSSTTQTVFSARPSLAVLTNKYVPALISLFSCFSSSEHVRSWTLSFLGGCFPCTRGGKGRWQWAGWRSAQVSPRQTEQGLPCALPWVSQEPSAWSEDEDDHELGGGWAVPREWTLQPVVQQDILGSLRSAEGSKPGSFSEPQFPQL